MGWIEKLPIGIKVFLISFFAGLLLYLLFPLFIIVNYFSGKECARNPQVLCDFEFWILFLILALILWLSGFFLLIKFFNKFKIPRTPLIIGLGTFTILIVEFMFYMNDFWRLEFFLILYPLTYAGYYWLFNRLIPRIEGKKKLPTPEG